MKDFIAAATVSANTMLPLPLLSSSLVHEVVYSPRVLGAAGYSEAAARAAWVRSQLQQPLLGGPDALVHMDLLGPEVGSKACFNAVLSRSFAGRRKRSRVTVEVDVVDGCAKLFPDDVYDEWNETQHQDWSKTIDLEIITPSHR